MKLSVFSVFDLASGLYAQPFCVASRGVAVRAFGDGCMDESPKNAWHSHPEHFVLYCLGEFDDASGLFATGVPEQVSLATDFVQVLSDTGAARAVGRPANARSANGSVV